MILLTVYLFAWIIDWFRTQTDLIEHAPDHAQYDHGCLGTQVSVPLFSRNGDRFTGRYPENHSPYLVQIQLKFKQQQAC